MTDKIKQRLIGAVVLVSLAVIFIPMLLDGGEGAFRPVDEGIPQQPELEFEPLDIPLQVQETPPERPRVIDKPQVDEPKPVPTVQPKPQTEVKPQETIPESKPAQTGEPVRWVVQVGSFSQSANALALRDKLRGKGFTTFVEKYSDAGKTSYRVRVGPELKRATAEKHQQRLQKEMQIKGIVMGYP